MNPSSLSQADRATQQTRDQADRQMPVMDGFEAARQIRAQELHAVQARHIGPQKQTGRAMQPVLGQLDDGGAASIAA